MATAETTVRRAPVRPSDRRVVIAGAGKVGRSIAGELLENGAEVLMIERDPAKVRLDALPGASWLLADACELAQLDAAGLNDYAVLVAATGDDKVNLVVSLLAKTEFGIPRVVARVNHPKNEWLFTDSWGVDVAVSAPRLLTALVEEAVSVGDLVRLMRFRQSDASLVELTLAEDAPLTGRRLGEFELPADSALVVILRDGRAVIPSPDATLEAGDEVLAVATTLEAEEQLAVLLGPPPPDSGT
ncbi:TrkA family potassium uptake protein [Frankia sp. AiPa1]|uniref:potassium channel family protein n=1 Tax=Frankia sp. AiPa1 TaxID=573492 RepID=UPI00202B1FFB|nr:TrkA family potassium uptake protein [Frankia sp. AiPa1]MCL9758071.1 TrkA family potassium uptake protein [Frankia sp. AiPa1]